MKVVLSAVKLRVCSKAGCRSRGLPLDRHHVRSEKLFVHAFEQSRRGEKKYQNFVARYWRFDPRDWIYLCRYHHEQLHRRYLAMLRKNTKRLRRFPVLWSWAEAEQFMDSLGTLCSKWVKVPDRRKAA